MYAAEIIECVTKNFFYKCEHGVCKHPARRFYAHAADWQGCRVEGTINLCELHERYVRNYNCTAPGSLDTRL